MGQRSAPSGGTLASVLNLFDGYSLKELHHAHSPYSISPIPGPKVASPKSWITKLFGVVTVPDLGILTTNIGAAANVAIVQRSWGLFGGSYGPRFTYSEYMQSRNYLTAISFHLALTVASIFLTIPFIRSLVKKAVYQPGEGAAKEDTTSDRVEYRGIAVPDIQTPNPPRAYVRAHYEGGIYQCTSQTDLPLLSNG